MDSVDEDCKCLLEQENAEEKELRNKRRWLLGLPTSEDEDEDEDEDDDDEDGEDEDDDDDEGDEEEDEGGEEGDEYEYEYGYEDEDVKGSHVEIERNPIPESLLRDDDVSYEIIKSLVEKGVCNNKKKYHISEDEMQLVHSPRDVRGVLHLIKDMTNQGLERFTEALTGGSVNFEKTRRKMNQAIKGCLLSSSNKRWRIKLDDNQSSILKNPHNYRWSSECRFIPADSDSYDVAVHKILDALEDFPTLTLSAMHRKLKGTKDYVPRLIPKKSGWARDKLIKQLRKKCFKLLLKKPINNDNGVGDSLLSKAMDVGGLHLKLIEGCEYATNFIIQSSSEKNALQNEIAKSIKLVDDDEIVGISMLKDIQVVVDPNSKKLPEKKLQASIKNWLTEYLFEFSDMDPVPECLHQVLAMIRKCSREAAAAAPYKKKKLEEMHVEGDIESILSLSASMKQLVWDLIPPSEDEKLDQEFADAYMEDLEDSYDDDDDDDDDNDDDENNISAASTSKGKVHFLQRMHLMRHHSVILKNTQEEEEEEGHNENPVMYDNQKSMSKSNQYLAVQAATDEASMVAYRLIDHMLNDFLQESEQQQSSSLGVEEGEETSKQKKRKAARKEPDTLEEGDDGSDSGSSVLLKAVEGLLPSLAKKCEGLKKLRRSSKYKKSKRSC